MPASHDGLGMSLLGTSTGKTNSRTQGRISSIKPKKGEIESKQILKRQSKIEKEVIY